MEDDIQTLSVGAGLDSLLGEFAKMSDGYMTFRPTLESTAGQLRDTQAAISIFNDFIIQYFIESGGVPKYSSLRAARLPAAKVSWLPDTIWRTCRG